MNTKHCLVISGIIGGVIGSLLTALLVSPVTAQRDKFDEIECTKLTIVDSLGHKYAELGIDSVTKGRGGMFKLYNSPWFRNTSNVVVSIGDGGYGGLIRVYHEDGQRLVEIGKITGKYSTDNSEIKVYHKDGPRLVEIGSHNINSESGEASFYSKDGKASAGIGVFLDLGYVSLRDDKGELQ